MAEDHGLSNGDGPIEVTQGLELLVSVIAQDVILLDGVQCLLLTLQFDNVWVWDHFLGKVPYRVFKGGREKQHLAVPGQHPAREGPGVWHEPEFFTGMSSSTASQAWMVKYVPWKVAEVEEHCGEEAGPDMGQGQGGIGFPRSFSSTQVGLWSLLT